MEFFARETLAPYFGSLVNPGVLAVVTVMTLMFVSGLGAFAIEWCERVGQTIHRQLGRSQMWTARRSVGH